MKTNQTPNLTGKHVLIIGPTESGKSHTLKYLLNTTPGEIHVLDPHSSPHKWPTNCQVHGGARKFNEIQTILDYTLKELQNRAEQLEQGTDNFTPLTIALDEQPSIVENVPNATETFGTISREGRKFKIFLNVATQSDRVKTLGINGEGDILDNFAKITMTTTPLNFKGNSKTATLTIGNTKTKITIPKTITSLKQKTPINTLQEKVLVSTLEAAPIDTNMPSRTAFGKALYETFTPTAKKGALRTFQRARQLFLFITLGGTYALLRHKADKMKT